MILVRDVVRYGSSGVHIDFVALSNAGSGRRERNQRVAARFLATCFTSAENPRCLSFSLSSASNATNFKCLN